MKNKHLLKKFTKNYSDYFEEFIQNDLVESFQLFKEATEWDV